MILANRKGNDEHSTINLAHNTNIPNNNSSILNNNGDSFTQPNSNNNNYQCLMLDSLLLRSNSESFSIDRNQIKNLSMITNENNRERVLSFNSNINNSQPVNKHPKNFLNQIKNMVEQKSLTDTFHIHNKINSISSRLREINQTPERILDAPNLIDDYYLNLIDWSSQNVLAVSLGKSVYLWNGNTFETFQLVSDDNNICSVNWMNSGDCLAVGLYNGTIQLWDTAKLQQIREMPGHISRVCSLSWNNYLLSSGSKDTKIMNHDVRQRNHLVHTLIGHTQEVCALNWSPDGTLLASGGNDNLLCIWDVNGTNLNSNRNRSVGMGAGTGTGTGTGNGTGTGMGAGAGVNNVVNNFISIHNNNLLNSSNTPGLFTTNTSNSIWNIVEENQNNNFNITDSRSSGSFSNSRNGNYSNYNTTSHNQYNNTSQVQIQPKYIFTQHEAAVKALAWCPWQKGLLASGGGAKDKSIKFWNVDNGLLINSVETGSQVCSLLWSKHEKELISSHGFSKHQISLWKYPSMHKITELSGHMSRVLYLSMSPNGCSIVSGAGDETLRFWKIHDYKKNTNDEINNKSTSCNILNNFQLR